MLFEAQQIAYKSIAAATKILLAVIPVPKPMTMTGVGSVSKFGASASGLGFGKALIVTDEMLVKLGVIKPLLNSLEKGGVEYVIFDKVLPDPDFSIVEAGLAMLKENQCDSVIAIGGGSSLDAAKVMKVAATHEKSPKKFTGILKCRNKGLPFAAIPTTAGTGSEVTIAAVITDREAGKKATIIDPKLVPDIAVLDAELMVGLPPHITAATAMDALTHAVEAYISKWAADDTDALATSAVKLIFGNLEEAYNNGSNLEAREALANASHLAGLAFTKANLGYVHAIAHQLGAKYHIPHGLANAVVLPHVLEFNLGAAKERLAELALAIGDENPSDPEAVLAKRFLNRVIELNARVGIPTHLENIKDEDTPLLAKKAVLEAIMTPYAVPKYMQKSDVLGIIKKIQKPAA